MYLVLSRDSWFGIKGTSARSLASASRIKVLQLLLIPQPTEKRLSSRPENTMVDREPNQAAVMSHDLGSTRTIAADGGSDDGKTHQFNEQTNYVPKRAIITVRIS